MMKRRGFLSALAATGAFGAVAPRARADGRQPGAGGERAYWLGVLKRLAEPVLSNLAEQRMRERMPVEAVRALGEYRWPGNVRELEAVLERLAAESGDGGVITAGQVRRETSVATAAMSGGGEIQYVGVLRAGEPLGDHFDRQQLMLYEQVRSRVGGSHTRAARWLGMERTALYHRLERARQRAGKPE